MKGSSHPTTGQGWDGILMPSEEILWQGRPDASFAIGVAQIGAALFGCLFAGFALFWMIKASMAGGYFWTFGLIHFSVGVAMILGALVYGPWRRRHTWYTLTNRRAFIATDLPFLGRKLKSWPIDGSAKLDYQPGDMATITFARDFRQTKNGTREVPIGFERIADGNTVYRLMTDIRDAQNQRTEAAE